MAVQISEDFNGSVGFQFLKLNMTSSIKHIFKSMAIFSIIYINLNYRLLCSTKDLKQ